MTYIKDIIPNLYRNEFFDLAAWIWQACLINTKQVKIEGKEVEINITQDQAIESFRNYFGISEDNADTDTLKSIYYRNQRKFIIAKKQDAHNIVFGDDELSEKIELLKSEVNELCKQVKYEGIKKESPNIR